MFATGSRDGAVRLWSLLLCKEGSSSSSSSSSGSSGTCLIGEVGTEVSATFTLAGALAQFSSQGYLDGGSEAEGADGAVTSLCFRPCPHPFSLPCSLHLAVGRASGSIALWELICHAAAAVQATRTVHIAAAHVGAVTSMAWREGEAGSACLASGGADGSIKFWRAPPQRT